MTGNDDLQPQDGLNNYHIVFSRLEPQPGGGAVVTFALTESMQHLAEMVVSVPPGSEGLDRVLVDAHDAIIGILRQLLFRAAKARGIHEKNAERMLPEVALPIEEEPEEQEDLEFRMD